MCTRVVYSGTNGMVATGRSMDWKTEMHSNLWAFPRGMMRSGEAGENSLKWTSRYGSVVTSAFEIASTDGMNEKGLVANLLWLPETKYPLRDKNKPGLSDAVGDCAIFEYVGGRLTVYHNKDYKVMTNSPTYDKQLALNEYWKTIGGLSFLPGTNRAADRFARASFYINALPKTDDERIAVASVFSVVRNVSVPYGISTPESPEISTTQWRTVSESKSLRYFFESSLTPNTFWVDLRDLDFSEGAPVLKLSIANGEMYHGNTAKEFKIALPFKLWELEDKRIL